MSMPDTDELDMILAEFHKVAVTASDPMQMSRAHQEAKQSITRYAERQAIRARIDELERLPGIKFEDDFQTIDERYISYTHYQTRIAELEATIRTKGDQA